MEYAIDVLFFASLQNVMSACKIFFEEISLKANLDLKCKSVYCNFSFWHSFFSLALPVSFYEQEQNVS